MTLGAALATAKNSMRATSAQIGIVSQNMAGVRDPNYTRRSSETQAGLHGAVSIRLRREDAPPLLINYMGKSSQYATANVVAHGVARMAEIHDIQDYSNSPARLLGEFRDSLQTYFNQYDQAETGNAAIHAARKLVISLNYGNQELEKLRTDADRDIKASVDHINDTLGQFKEINDNIVKAQLTGLDLHGLLDKRDALLKELSQEIGITGVTHDDGSMALYGADGSTLFDKTARSVTFTPSVSLAAGVSGGMVYVDGVPLDHGSFQEQNGSGTLGGLLQLRDELAPKYQKQLDEIANALTDMFQGPPPLFLDGGDAKATGLSGRLRVNDAFDLHAGGTPSALGSREKILQLVNGFDKQRSYDPDTEIAGDPNIIAFAAKSTAWLETVHKQSNIEVEYQQTMFVRAGEALSNQTGVNSDEEMALLLQLEQSYAASARIISTVGRMMDELMAAI